MSLIIRADSNKDLADLAKLLLEKFNAFYQLPDGRTVISSQTPAEQPVVVITDEDIYSRVYIGKVEFKAGEAGFPQLASTQFKITDTNGAIFTNVDIDLYRDGILQIGSTFDYDSLNGIVSITSPLKSTNGTPETVTVKIYRQNMLVNASVVAIAPPPSTNNAFPYTFPYTLS